MSNNIKLKKINNSFESEPSCSSGSSASETNYYEPAQSPLFNVDSNLSAILKPQHKSSLIIDQRIKLRDMVVHSSQESNFEGFTSSQIKLFAGKFFKTNSPFKKANEPIEIMTEQFKLRGMAVHSSQETSFEGFTDSQIKNVEQYLPSKSLKKDNIADNILCNRDKNEIHTVYEMMVVENSCNAVDIPEADIRDLSQTLNDENASSLDLSFNGKIKHLSECHADTTVDTSTKDISETSGVSASDNSSFIFINDKSPDLFADDEDDDGKNDDNKHDGFVEERIDDVKQPQLKLSCIESTLNCLDKINEIETTPPILSQAAFNFGLKRDKELFKRVRSSLSRLPPPHSVRNPEINLFKSVCENKEDIMKFGECVKNVENGDHNDEILWKPSHPLDEIKCMDWKDIVNVNHQGIYFNLSTTSEKIEELGLDVIDRYIGRETQSSFYLSPSSAKKRNMRMKLLTQSPGSRLSHLAKRRTIFSSANLMSQKLAATTGARQILLDSKQPRQKRKATPKRRTPGSRKKIVRKTPTSSARKRLFFRTEQVKPAPSRETSKRALFQSPPKQLLSSFAAVKPIIKPEIATRVEKSKRALFSPDKLSQSSYTSSCADMLSQPTTSANIPPMPIGSFENSIKRKRNSSGFDNVDDIENNSNKMFRSNDGILTPRTLKIKSQSFCMGVGNNSSINSNSIRSSSGKSLLRAASDTSVSSQLTDNHRKKLLWAVSQALQTKQINVSHPSFKQYASVLARVIKRIFLEHYLNNTSSQRGSTSEIMLKLANNHVYYVMKGRTADEVYMLAKSQIIEDTQKETSAKLSGYVTPQEYENYKTHLKKTTSSVFGVENSLDSFTLSQSFCSQQNSSQNTEMSFSSGQNFSCFKQQSNSAMKLPIQPNKTLQNSSSKNNMSGLALRENVDSEQRRSGQKNFTGKDQRNVSPYSDKIKSASKAASVIAYPAKFGDLNSSKVKRVISFDN